MIEVLGITLRTLNYGNDGIFLIMGMQDLYHQPYYCSLMVVTIYVYSLLFVMMIASVP